MSYSRTSRAITRVQTILDDLLLADGPREWPAKDAHRLAYHLREAFAAATRLPAEYRKYASLKERFVIRARDGLVAAEPRVRSPFEATEVKFALGRITLRDVVTFEEAIGAVLKHSIEEIHLPHFPNDDEERAKLFRWTEANHVSIINHEEEGITLTRRDAGEMKWLPS